MLYHKLRTCKAFLQYEFACAVLKMQKLKMIYHKLHICTVFLQCEFACVFLNSVRVKMLYYKTIIRFFSSMNPHMSFQIT